MIAEGTHSGKLSLCWFGVFLVSLAVVVGGGKGSLCCLRDVGLLIDRGRSIVALMCTANLLVLARAACMMFDCCRVGGEVS